MLILRSALFNALFYLVLIGLMLVGLPALFCGRHAIFRLARLWSRTSLWLLDKICGMRVEFRGVENIPSGGTIVAAKHQSIWETFALLGFFPDFAFILKRELAFIPLFGWYLARCRADRHQPFRRPHGPRSGDGMRAHAVERRPAGLHFPGRNAAAGGRPAGL